MHLGNASITVLMRWVIASAIAELFWSRSVSVATSGARAGAGADANARAGFAAAAATGAVAASGRTF